MNYLKIALEHITGHQISNYAFLTSTPFLEFAKSLEDKSKPYHFNKVELDKDINKIKKEGFLLVYKDDFISYNGYFFEGVSRIYSNKEIKNILNSEESVFVK